MRRGLAGVPERHAARSGAAVSYTLARSRADSADRAWKGIAVVLTISPGAEPIPGYRLLERLGIGGFGEVWKAEGKGGQSIALKIVELKSRQSDEELQSLQLIAGIRHPHLLHILGHWVSDQYLLIATELAEGTAQDLAERHRRDGLAGIPRDALLNIIAQAAVAIDYLNAPAHEYGGRKVSIQHRDIKPENIFLTHGHVRVGDFGLAKVLEQLSDQHSGKGTLLYSPPEMLEGEICHASDQYSLALTYCQLLTGNLPFPGKTTLERLWSRVKGPPTLDDYPPAERAVLLQALAIRPEDRFPACATFARELERAHASQGGAATTGEPAALQTERAAPIVPAALTLGPLGTRERVDRLTRAATSTRGLVPAPFSDFGEHDLVLRPLPSGFVPVPGCPVHESGYPTEIISEMDGGEMVFVPAGEFLSGVGRPERGLGRTYLSAFYIDKYPTTNAQFQWFCRSADYTRADRWPWGDDGAGLVNRSAHPAVWVTWDDAVAFCQWAGKALPTEAQWEKAARGVDGRPFPWGSEPPIEGNQIRCNLRGARASDNGRTCPVGMFANGASPYGCFDLAGNVWEWCHDWFHPDLQLRGYRNPAGPPSGRYRVLRGGSWANGPDLVTADVRNHLIPDCRGPTIGFRTVLKLDEGF